MSGSPSLGSVAKQDSGGLPALLPEHRPDPFIDSAVATIQEMGSRSDPDVDPLELVSILDPGSQPNITDQFPKKSGEPELSPAPLSVPQQVLAALAHPIEEKPPRQRPLDPGIGVALAYFKLSIGTQKNNYAKLLTQSIFLETEELAIAAVEKMDRESQKTLLTESYFVTSQKKTEILLDALRLAALQNRLTLFRVLLNLKEEQNWVVPTDDEDPYGLNLAHFVALNDNGAFPLKDIPLVAHLCTQPNKSGASPEDFALWLSEPLSMPVHALGPDQPSLSPQEFHQLTGRQYWVRPRLTPGALLGLCFETPVIGTPSYLSTFLKPKIDHHLDRGPQIPCKLKIRKMGGKDLPPQMKGQWECLVSQDVAKGDVLAIYTGLTLYSVWTGSQKAYRKGINICERFIVDADQGGGSLAEYINHGFPNCAFWEHLYRGFPVLAMIALENLKANTRLTSHYGPSYFKDKSLTCVTLNQPDIDQFLTATQRLRKIPFIEFKPDGKSYTYGDRGKMPLKRLQNPASESDAIDAFSNTLKLNYLATFQLTQLKSTLDNPIHRWLKGFAPKE